MKFCCQKFQYDWSVSKVSPLNIRIVKISLDEIPRIDPKYPYRFYLTAGYEEGEKGVAVRFLDYCPYCGTNLFRFYKKDDYINEIDQSFLWPK